MKITNLTQINHINFNGKKNNNSQPTKNRPIQYIAIPVAAITMLTGLDGCNKIEISDKDKFEKQDSLEIVKPPKDTSGIEVIIDTTYNEIYHEIEI